MKKPKNKTNKKPNKKSRKSNRKKNHKKLLLALSLSIFTCFFLFLVVETYINYKRVSLFLEYGHASSKLVVYSSSKKYYQGQTSDLASFVDQLKNRAYTIKKFTKLLKEIQVAAKLGGDSLDGNARLKTAVLAARAQSVPGDNIDRAIKKGTGDVDGVDYEEIVYEGYAPGGVALLINALTDNKTRTVAEVRHALSKFGGSLAGANSVAFMFKKKAVFSVPKEEASEDELFESLIDAGLEEIQEDSESWELFSEVDSFSDLQSTLEKLGKKNEGALRYIPENLVKVEGEDAQKLLNLLDFLDDLDDIQSVTGNFELDDNVLV